MRRLTAEAEKSKKVKAILDRVMTKELTLHAAMIEAGFRDKKVQIPLTVEGAARVLMKHFTKEELRMLVEKLQ